ncbi:SpoIIE family protein phosphatase [Streptomyces sp. NPDC090108]|uniref:SpoIIE family protein phosphatase n=1 Tax=Streptomyces sp. NPDC090108 TaxID=3365947 RepID=UPI0038247EB3
MNVSRNMAADPGRGFDEAVLGALFSDCPQPLYVLDADLCLAGFNDAARRDGAFPLEGALGRPLGHWAPALHHGPVEAALREVLATGTAATGIEVVAAGPAGTPVRVLTVSAYRLGVTGDGVRGLALTVEDTTDRCRARVRLDVLREAGVRIGSTLDLVPTAQELADVSVPGLADMAIVDVMDSVLRGDVPSVESLGHRLLLRCAGYRCVRPGGDGDAPELGGVLEPTLTDRYRHILVRRQALLISGRTPEEARATGHELVPEGTAHAHLAVPLCARGGVLGLVRFYRPFTPVPFGPDDLRLAGELARHTALCLDNARLYTRERSVARILQSSLRPPHMSGHDAVETAHSYLPSSTSGDWFDIIPLSGARVALVVGEPPARGLRAAVTMGGMRAAIGALASLDLPPEEILERVHELVTRLDAEESRRPAESQDTRRAGTSCLYTVYDPVSRRCTLASAGHPPPALARPGDPVSFAQVPVGPPLGRGRGRYRSVRTELPEGTVLVLCNQVLLRAAGPGSAEQLERLGDALRPGDRPLEEICESVLKSLAPRPDPTTDGVLLLARTLALSGDRVASWTLSNDPAAVGEARHRTVRHLRRWGLSELEFGASVVVSELVTNAVRYSDGPIVLRLVRDHALIIEVTDDSSTAPQLRQAEDDDEHGRGLSITSQLTERWGTRREHRGKTIWAELAVPEDEETEAAS